MNPQAEFTSKPQDRSLMIVAALVGGSLCCCLAAVALYFVAIASSFPLILERSRRTPTAISLVEINSGSTFGKFYFGAGDVDNFCHVETLTDTFSQEDLLRNKYIYFSAPFASKYEGDTLDWSLYDTDGVPVDIGERHSRTLDGDMENCFQTILNISPRIKPGKYILEVKHEKQLAFKEVFTITYSDIANIPRPKREPFSDFSLGREVDITQTTCRAGGQLVSYSVDGLDESPWFYLVSPYQLGDLDKKFYWTVRNETGKKIYDHIERVIDDDIDLCMWQGFSMEGSKPGIYTVVIEDEVSKVIYETVFELK